MFTSRTSRFALVTIVAATAVSIGVAAWTQPHSVGLYYFTSPAPQQLAPGSPAYLDVLVQEAVLPDEVVPALRSLHRRMMQERCEPTSTIVDGDVALCNGARLEAADLDLAVQRFGALVDARRATQKADKIRHYLTWMSMAIAVWAGLASLFAAGAWVLRGRPSTH